MAEGNDSGAASTSSEGPSPPPDAPTSVPNAAAAMVSVPPIPSREPEDRQEILNKARAFLHQPQIQREDVLSKRRFLAAKGLNESEIEGLMREVPVQRPLVPPRSYPQPPPSNLPVILLGLARLFSWIAGGSAALAFIYYRIILPRITATSMARGSLKSHQLSLIHKLNASLAAFKESQVESASVLPKPQPPKEPPAFAACSSLDALLEQAKTQNIEISGISEISLLRCTISDFNNGPDPRNPRTEEVFQFLEGKIPWLVSDEGVPFEHRLWDILSTCPLFVAGLSPPLDSPDPPADAPEIVYWRYVPPVPHPPTALVQSLSALSASIPKPSAEKHSPFQHALQSMTDFTGYISSQMYAPYLPVRYGPSSSANPAEEEVRKEIRALKGLVLNRRTFMPTPMRPQ